MKNLVIDVNKRILSEADKDKSKCGLFGLFGFYVQIILAVLCFLILVCKKYKI